MWDFPGDEDVTRVARAVYERGALHSAAPDFTEHAVRDGRLVTGQNPASAARVAEEVVAALTGN
jgi:putative intracellular protease/amidase